MSNSTSAAVFRRRRIVAGGIALVLVFGLIWSVSSLVRVVFSPLPALATTLTVDPELPSNTNALTLPASGSLAFAADGFENPLVVTGSTSQVPIASIAKVITALVVLEEKPIPASGAEPTITFTAEDVARYETQYSENQSVTPVAAGLEMPLTDALTVLLVASANNYATSLAEWAFGSVEEYVAAANEWVAKQELASTVVADASGLSESNVSTTVDLLKLAGIAHENKVIAAIVALPSAEIAGVGKITNTNKLLGQEGITGIKTGTTVAAGACLLFSADLAVRDATITTYGVMLGVENHDVLDAQLLAFLASARQAFSEVTAVEEGDVIGTASSQWGQQSNLVAASDLTVLTFPGVETSLQLSKSQTSVGKAGTDAGNLSVTLRSDAPSIDVLLVEEISEAGFWWRLNHQDALALSQHEWVKMVLVQSDQLKVRAA